MVASFEVDLARSQACLKTLDTLVHTQFAHKENVRDNAEKISRDNSERMQDNEGDAVIGEESERSAHT